jgi:hypothetical protein
MLFNFIDLLTDFNLKPESSASPSRTLRVKKKKMKKKLLLLVDAEDEEDVVSWRWKRR